MRIFNLSFTTKHSFTAFTCSLVNRVQSYEEYPDKPNIALRLAVKQHGEKG